MKNFTNRMKLWIPVLLIGILIVANTTKVIAQNSYFINKTASPSSIQSGQTITYTIGYSTAAAVNNLVITETVPAGFTITSCSKPYTQLGNILTFNLGGFAGGYSTITITGTFSCGSTCNNTFVIDTATINAQNLPTLTDTAGVTITAINPWKIVKIPVTLYNAGNYYGALGGTVRYMIIVYKTTPWWSCSGELNLNSAQVIDNIGANAQLVGVYDQSQTQIFPSQAGNTYTWPSGNLLANSGLNYYYYAPTNTGYSYAKIYYIDIKYPCNAGFFNGQTVSNTATLSGMLPCGNQPVTTSNTANVILQDPGASGNFVKFNNIHYSPGSQVPGCNSSYNIGLNNNGSVPLTNINVNDTFPNQLDITNISIISSNYPVNLYYWKQTGCGPVTGPIAYSGNPINSSVNLLKATLVGVGPHLYAFKLTGNNLMVGGNINVGLGYNILSTDWCGGNVIPGTVVQNCANSTYKGDYSLIDSAGCVFANNVYHGIINQTYCDTFHIINPLPNLILYKYVCAPKSCFQPRDTVRYHIFFYNVGSGALAAGAILSDALPLGLSYVPFSDIWYSSSFSSNTCSSGTPIAGVTCNNNLTNPQWTLPAGLAGNCGNNSQVYWSADFSVVVNNNAAAGSLSNGYTISGGGLAGIKYSTHANINICPLDSLIAEKQVSIDNGATWQQNVTVIPGGTAKFRLKIRNVGTVPITNISIVDILPASGDVGVVSCTGRGSLFNVNLTGPLPTPAGLPPYTLPYSTQINPCRSAELCNAPNCVGCMPAAWNASWATARTFRLNYGASILSPNQILIYDYDVQVPVTAKKGESACNSFGYCATRTNNNISTLAAENYPYACITVGEDTSCNCNGSKWSDITIKNPAGQYLLIKCDSTYPVKCNSTYTINAFFTCAGQHCQGSVQYKLKEPNNNIISGNVVPFTFTASQPGTYTLTLYGLCGNKVCDSCIIKFKTDCKDDGCSCEGSKWDHITMSWNDIIDNGDPNVPNKNIITSDGTGRIDPKVIIGGQHAISIDCNSPQHGPATLPCNKTFTITGAFVCNKPGCAKVLYTMVYPNGLTLTGTLGSLTFTTNQTGWYSISFYGMCGNDTCKTCFYRFQVDCGDVKPDCPCPYNISVKEPMVQTYVLASPAATIASSFFTIMGPAGPLFTEIRAEVMSYALLSNNGDACINCKSYPFTWASMYTAGAVGAMLPKITMYGTTVAAFNPSGNGIYQNPREVIWNNGGAPFALPNSLNMQFLLPPASIIDCCELTAKICVKFVFRDINCKECETTVCFSVPIKKTGGGNNNGK